MGLDGISGLTGLSGIIGGAIALAPDSTVNGSAMALLADYGFASPEVALGTISPTYFWPRVPNMPAKALATTGTLLCAFLDENGATGADSSAIYIVLGRSTDKGATWTFQTLATVANTLGLLNPVLVQRSNGTVYCVYGQCPNSANTAAGWKDFSNNVPAVTRGVKAFTINDAGTDGVSWGAATEITSNITVPDNANAMTISSWSNNGTDYTFISSAPNGNIATNWYLKFTGVTDSGGSAINNNVFQVTKTDTTHWVLTGAGKVGTPSGGTATPQLAWFIPGGQGHALRVTDQLNFPFYGRSGPNAGGGPVSFNVWFDGVTWGVSTQDTSLAVIGEIEPSLCELPVNGNVYMKFRAGSGSNPGHKISTDGGKSFAGQIIDDGTGGTTKIISGSALGALIDLGGGQTLRLEPCSTVKRNRLTALISNNLTSVGGTWTKLRTLCSRTAAYSTVTKCIDGTLVGLFETDTDEEILAGAPGRLGQVKFNAAAVNNAVDVIQLWFNDRASGQVGWGNRDWGGTGQHSQSVGSPVYTASGLTYGMSDYEILSSANQTAYYPDYLSTDSGSFILQVVFSIAASGTGVIIGGTSTVGSGTKGFKLVVNGSGFPEATIDDGTHQEVRTGIVAVNDGATYLVTMARSAGGFSLTTQDSTGAQLDLQFGTDHTTVAAGSLTSTARLCLCRYDDTATGRMSQAITVKASLYSRNVNTQTIALPLVKPVADTWDAIVTGGPADTSVIPAANLKLYALDPRCGYGSRSASLTFRAPLHAKAGTGVARIADYAQGLFTTGNRAIPYGIDSTSSNSGASGPGGYYAFNGVANAQPFDARSGNGGALSFDFIQNFSSPWSVFWLANVATGSKANQGIILKNYDGSVGFELFTHGFNSTPAPGFLSSTFQCRWFIAGAIIENTPYVMGLTFNGTNGAGASGITAYMIPLTTLPLTGTIVTNNSGGNLTLDSVVGSTASVSHPSAHVLQIGDDVLPATGKYGNIIVTNNLACGGTAASIAAMLNAVLVV